MNIQRKCAHSRCKHDCFTQWPWGLHLILWREHQNENQQRLVSQVGTSMGSTAFLEGGRKAMKGHVWSKKKGSSPAQKKILQRGISILFDAFFLMSIGMALLACAQTFELSSYKYSLLSVTRMWKQILPFTKASKKDTLKMYGCSKSCSAMCFWVHAHYTPQTLPNIYCMTSAHLSTKRFF